MRTYRREASTKNWNGESEKESSSVYVCVCVRESVKKANEQMDREKKKWQNTNAKWHGIAAFARLSTSCISGERAQRSGSGSGKGPTLGGRKKNAAK